MDYTELHIKLNKPENGEVITALLDEFQFESFDIQGLDWKGYLPGSNQQNWSTILNEKIPASMIREWSVKNIEDQNWNATWEKDYPLIQIDDKVIIKAPFHKVPQQFEGLEVNIQPKMSFGTGHHQTTFLMAREMFEWDLEGRSFLDMGAGTGVLGIIAEKRGAKKIIAVDNESWAFENMKENYDLNDCEKMECVLSEVVPKDQFDFIWANINKNILMSMAQNFNETLQPGGVLAMSGFFRTDMDEIGMHFETLGLKRIKEQTKEDWAMMLFQK